MSRETASCLPVDRNVATILRTARLELHPLTDAHAGIYCRLYGDPMVMRFIAAPLAQDAALQALGRALRQTAESPPSAHYWIARDASGECGLLALLQDRERTGSAEAGILLLPAGAGLGYAREAMAALVTHAFSRLEVQCIRTRHHPGNRAVVGLMRALGFRPGTSTASERRWSLDNREWAAKAPSPARFAKQPAAG